MDSYLVGLDFPIGILGRVWYLIVSIPDLCNLTYFDALTLAWAFIYTNYICEHAVKILAFLSTGAFRQWLIEYSNV